MDIAACSMFFVAFLRRSSALIQADASAISLRSMALSSCVSARGGDVALLGVAMPGGWEVMF